MNNADTVFNPLKRCMKKKLPWIYIRTWFRLFPKERERERERERGRERERERGGGERERENKYR